MRVRTEVPLLTSLTARPNRLTITASACPTCLLSAALAQTASFKTHIHSSVVGDSFACFALFARTRSAHDSHFAHFLGESNFVYCRKRSPTCSGQKQEERRGLSVLSVFVLLQTTPAGLVLRIFGNIPGVFMCTAHLCWCQWVFSPHSACQMSLKYGSSRARPHCYIKRCTFYE